MTRYYVEVDGKEIALDVHSGDEGTQIQFTTAPSGTELSDGAPHNTQSPARVDFAAVLSNIETGAGLYSIVVDGVSWQVNVESTSEGLRMMSSGHRFDVNVLTEREWRLKKVAPRQAAHSGAITVKAPMPGLVKAVVVSVGDEVHAGQRLVVLEAMKMENEIDSPGSGRVTAVHVTAGNTIEGGKPLVTLES